MLLPIDALRAEVRATGAAALETLPPVLIARETLLGDLSFSGPDGLTPTRGGATLLLEGPLTALEPMHAQDRTGRKRLPEERYLPVEPGATGFIRVGRSSDNDVVIKDPSVSSHHVKLFRIATTNWCFVVDLASRNGTALNNRRLGEGVRGELASGDELALGRLVFVFLLPADLYEYLTV